MDFGTEITWSKTNTICNDMILADVDDAELVDIKYWKRKKSEENGDEMIPIIEWNILRRCVSSFCDIFFVIHLLFLSCETIYYIREVSFQTKKFFAVKRNVYL